MKLKNSQLILVRQLDKKVMSYSTLTGLTAPPEGWIRTFRKTLNMSLKQLGKRLSISAQGVKDLEKREADNSITLRSLKEAGKALNMQLVYGFVPIGDSLEEMIEKRAHDIAITIVKRTSITMSLEDQANTSDRLKQAVDELTQDIKREVPKNLWD